MVELVLPNHRSAVGWNWQPRHASSMCIRDRLRLMIMCCVLSQGIAPESAID